MPGVLGALRSTRKSGGVPSPDAPLVPASSVLGPRSSRPSREAAPAFHKPLPGHQPADLPSPEGWCCPGSWHRQVDEQESQAGRGHPKVRRRGQRPSMDRRWTDPNCVRGTGLRPWGQEGAMGCPPLGTPTCPLWSTQAAWSLGRPQPAWSQQRKGPALGQADQGQGWAASDAGTPTSLRLRPQERSQHVAPPLAVSQQPTRGPDRPHSGPPGLVTRSCTHGDTTGPPGGATAGGPTESSRGWRQRSWHWLGQIPDTLQEPGAASPRHHMPADEGEPPWHQEKGAGPRHHLWGKAAEQPSSFLRSRTLGCTCQPAAGEGQEGDHPGHLGRNERHSKPLLRPPQPSVSHSCCP